MTTNADLDSKIVELDRAREQGTAWLAKCIMENGKPLPNLANALIAIEAVMPHAFAYDAMLRAPMLMMSLKSDDGFKRRVVRDDDVGIVQDKLQHLGLKRISKDTMHQAVDMRGPCPAISSGARLSQCADLGSQTAFGDVPPGLFRRRGE